MSLKSSSADMTAREEYNTQKQKDGWWDAGAEGRETKGCRQSTLSSLQ